MISLKKVITKPDGRITYKLYGKEVYHRDKCSVLVNKSLNFEGYLYVHTLPNLILQDRNPVYDTFYLKKKSKRDSPLDNEVTFFSKRVKHIVSEKVRTTSNAGNSFFGPISWLHL